MTDAPPDIRAALNVDRSLGGARWVFPAVDMESVARMAQRHDLPEFVARMLCLRGVDAERVQEFLFPT